MDVSLVQCHTYDEKLLYQKIKESIENIGGINKYFEPGETVLLKTNILMGSSPEKAVISHPVFVKTLGELLIHENNNKVIIGDSPGGPFTKMALNKIYKTCTYDKILSDSKIQLNNNFKTDQISFNEGKILKQVDIIDLLNEVDKVVSVSKLKTHGMMKFTGAVKNMFGVVPGIKKAEFHLRMPEVENFADALIDICLASKPTLSIMDGIVGMEGSGPSSGDPIQINTILASQSPYHLDVMATQLVSLDPMSVPTIKRSVDRHLIKEDYSDITLVGDAFEQLKIEKFKAPKISDVSFLKNYLPDTIADKIINYLRPKPVFNHDQCISCGVCAENCPPQVIDMIDNYPEVRLDGCIRCFCCQELCPVAAVDIKRLWIAEKILNY